MATTNSGFAITANGTLVTSANAANGTVLVTQGGLATQLSNAGIATRLDSELDLSKANYAKNGGAYLSLSASTPVNVDLTNIIATATSQAGDGVFATIYDIQFTNLGTQPVDVGAAGSNPFLGPMKGTAPVTTVPAGGSIHWHNPTGWSVTSGTNSILEFNPGSSAAQIGVAIGGA